jgi:hypothetical protein
MVADVLGLLERPVESIEWDTETVQTSSWNMLEFTLPSMKKDLAYLGNNLCFF